MVRGIPLPALWWRQSFFEARNTQISLFFPACRCHSLSSIMMNQCTTKEFKKYLTNVRYMLTLGRHRRQKYPRSEEIGGDLCEGIHVKAEPVVKRSHLRKTATEDILQVDECFQKILDIHKELFQYEMNLEAGWEMARLILTGENFNGYSPSCSTLEIIHDRGRSREP
jgi:hypothetical protein